MSTKAHGSKLKITHASIRMGEMQVGRGEQPLKTLLGSCIGLAMYSRRQAIGVAGCMSERPRHCTTATAMTTIAMPTHCTGSSD